MSAEFPRDVKSLNEQTLKHTLQQFYSKQLAITGIGGLERFAGLNDNWNSSIGRLEVKYKMENEGAADEKVDIVVKQPLGSNIIATFHKVTQPFCHEVIWYQYAADVLATAFPVLSEISPPCFYGHSPHQNAINPTFLEKHLGRNIGRLFRKTDKGLIIMENVSKRSSGRYVLLDKQKILDPNAAKVAINALAHFHGAWWQYCNGHLDVNMVNKSGEGHLAREDLLKYLQGGFPAWMITDSFRGQKGGLCGAKKLVRDRLQDKEMAEEICAKLDSYNKKKLLKEVHDFFGDPRPSKLNTVVHGDWWICNMLFSQPDYSKVMFLDFQNMVRGHPARDFWYFIYISTDMRWREEHLKDCLRLYYNTFSDYVSKYEEISYDLFEKEFMERRVVSGFLMGTSMVMWNVLSPNAAELERWTAYNALKNKIWEEMTGPDTEQVHPFVCEMRRRFLDAIVELADLDMF